MEEYKGMHFANKKKQQFYEGGAHFAYSDLINALEKLNIRQKFHISEKEEDNKKYMMTTQTRNVFHNSILRNQIFPTVIEENKKHIEYPIHKKEYNSIALRKPPSNNNLQIPLLPSFRNPSRNAKMISIAQNKYFISINKTEIKNKKSLNIFCTNTDNKKYKRTRLVTSIKKKDLSYTLTERNKSINSNAIGIFPLQSRGNSYLTKHKVTKYKGNITIKDIHYNTIGTKSSK